MTDPFAKRYITIHGHEVGYRAAGTGPVVVLVHGMAGSSDAWRPVMPRLAQDFTVVAPDLLGHGDSAKPRSDYSLGAFASCLRDLLVALGHERATFVGQSLGGGVVMQFAYQFPEQCERLVLVASGGLGEEVNLLLRTLTLPGVEYLLPLACNSWVHDVGMDIAGWLHRVGLDVSPRVGEVWKSYGSLADPATRTAFVQTLRSVVDHTGQRVSAADRLYLSAGVPTMIVWGDHDRIIPVAQGRAAHDAIAGSRLEIFEGCGHFPHCEEPLRFGEVLADFISTTTPASNVGQPWRDQLVAQSRVQSGI